MTGVRPATRDFIFLIFTGMNQNGMGFTSWYTGESKMVLVCFTCNIEFGPSSVGRVFGTWLTVKPPACCTRPGPFAGRSAYRPA